MHKREIYCHEYEPPVVDPTESVQQRAERLWEVTNFIGCGIARFEYSGRMQLETLIRHGLNPWHNVLEVGCGALCAGYWIMHFLDAGRYHGIEPNEYMFKAGRDHLLEPGLLEAKRPRFAHNDQYDFSVFGVKFDFFHAHSIWTHAPKKDIERMLDGFVATTNPGARFLTSFKPPGLTGREYMGDEWVGRSHKGHDPGICRHSRKWIRQACEARGLTVEILEKEKVHQMHKWALVRKP